MQPVNVEAKYYSNRVTPEPEVIQCHTSCKDTLVCGTAYRKGGAIIEDSLARSHKHLHPRVDTLLHGTHVCREPRSETGAHRGLLGAQPEALAAQVHNAAVLVIGRGCMAAPGGTARRRLLGVLLEGRGRFRQVLAEHQREQRRLGARDVPDACMAPLAHLSTDQEHRHVEKDSRCIVHGDSTWPAGTPQRRSTAHIWKERQRLRNAPGAVHPQWQHDHQLLGSTLRKGERCRV